MNNGWIYSAVVWAILVGAFGACVGVTLLRRLHAGRRHPVLLWLVVAMTMISISTFLEQGRVLIYQLSYDGWIDRGDFDTLYEMAALVAASKVLATVSIAGSASLKLALLNGSTDEAALRRGAMAGFIVALGWLGLALFIELFI